MRQIALALLFASPLFAAACNKNNADNSAANEAAVEASAATIYYKIAANAVTGNRTTGINGSFKITRASGADDGIESNLQGGACIVFRAQDLGYTQMAGTSCNNDNQCNNSHEGRGYCEMSTHSCWARPLADPDPLCKRSIDPGAPAQWPVNTDVPIGPPPGIPVPGNLKPNAQARIIACLKWAKEKGVCTPPQSMEKWGQPTTLP